MGHDSPTFRNLRALHIVNRGIDINLIMLSGISGVSDAEQVTKVTPEDCASALASSLAPAEQHPTIVNAFHHLLCKARQDTKCSADAVGMSD